MASQLQREAVRLDQAGTTHLVSMSRSFRDFQKAKKFCDVVFYCKDKRTVSAHKCMLFNKAAGPMKEFYQSDSDDLTLVLPDVSADDVNGIMRLLYMGRVNVRDLRAFRDAAAIIGFRELVEEVIKEDSGSDTDSGPEEDMAQEDCERDLWRPPPAGQRKVQGRTAVRQVSLLKPQYQRRLPEDREPDPNLRPIDRSDQPIRPNAEPSPNGETLEDIASFIKRSGETDYGDPPPDKKIKYDVQILQKDKEKCELSAQSPPKTEKKTGGCSRVYSCYSCLERIPGPVRNLAIHLSEKHFKEWFDSNFIQRDECQFCHISMRGFQLRHIMVDHEFLRQCIPEESIRVIFPETDTNTGAKTLVCSSCGDSFAVAAKLKEHLVKHIAKDFDRRHISKFYIPPPNPLTGEKNKIRCLLPLKICDYKTSEYPNIRRHMLTFHDWLVEFYPEKEYAIMTASEKKSRGGSSQLREIRHQEYFRRRASVMRRPDEDQCKMGQTNELRRMIDLKCISCPSDFTNTNHYKEHVASHYTDQLRAEYRDQIVYDDTMKKSMCPLCGQYKDKNGIYKHLALKHKEIQKYLPEKCSELFFTGLSNRKKVRASAPLLEEERPSEYWTPRELTKRGFCYQCKDKKYQDKSALQKHLVSHCRLMLYRRYNINSDTVSCPICQSHPKKKSTLIFHMVLIHNVLAKVLPPDVVTGFDDIQNMDAVMTEKQLKRMQNDRCPTCREKFHSRIEVRAHMTLVHFRKDLLMSYPMPLDYKCSVCSKVLRDEDDHILHIGVGHQTVNQFVPQGLQEAFGVDSLLHKEQVLNQGSDDYRVLDQAEDQQMIYGGPASNHHQFHQDQMLPNPQDLALDYDFGNFGDLPSNPACNLELAPIPEVYVPPVFQPDLPMLDIQPSPSSSSLSSSSHNEYVSLVKSSESDSAQEEMLSFPPSEINYLGRGLAPLDDYARAQLEVYDNDLMM